MNRRERRELSAEARRALGQPVEDIEFPGGSTRSSVRLVLADGNRVIATRRKTSRRADHEVHVMRVLHDNGGNVPKIYSFANGLLLQQDLGTKRLSETLHDPERKDDIPLLIEAALEGLARIHEAAAIGGLHEADLPVIGAEPEWCQGLANTPHEVGEMSGIKPPSYDAAAIAEIFAVRVPSFVKWDSRPGNALVGADGHVYWFDWEHSGLRNPMDDFVWLAADEFVTFSRRLEEKLFSGYRSRFAGTLTDSEAERYIRIMGCFHTCVRLQLALHYKGDGKWWNLQRCLEGDKVGVTRRCCRRLLRRAAHWADFDPLTRPLVPWYKDLEAYVEAM